MPGPATRPAPQEPASSAIRTLGEGHEGSSAIPGVERGLGQDLPAVGLPERAFLRDAGGVAAGPIRRRPERQGRLIVAIGLGVLLVDEAALIAASANPDVTAGVHGRDRGVAVGAIGDAD